MHDEVRKDFNFHDSQLLKDKPSESLEGILVACNNSPTIHVAIFFCM